MPAQSSPQLTLICPLVGAHFRPPAKQILAHLPAGAGLILEPEPENPFDPQAVKVSVPVTAIPESEFPALAQELPEAGLTLEQLMSGGTVWLGYIAKSSGKPLTQAQQSEPSLVGNAEVAEVTAQRGPGSARLAFGPDGSPRAQITWSGPEASPEGCPS